MDGSSPQILQVSVSTFNGMYIRELIKKYVEYWLENHFFHTKRNPLKIKVTWLCFNFNVRFNWFLKVVHLNNPLNHLPRVFHHHTTKIIVLIIPIHLVCWYILVYVPVLFVRRSCLHLPGDCVGCIREKYQMYHRLICAP